MPRSRDRLKGSYKDPTGISLTTITLAANVVFILPLVILFFVGQRYILRGMITSGLKG